MTDQQLNKFMKHVILASKKQEEKKASKDSLKKQVDKVKRIAGSKRLKRDELKEAVKELETRLNRVVEKEGDLVVAAEKEHRTSEEIKTRIAEVEEHLRKVNAKDLDMIDSLKNQIKGLEHELRVTGMKRTEEVHVNRAKIDELKSTISGLKERINKLIDTKTNREGIEKIEKELGVIKEMEAVEKAGFFDKLKAKFKKKPKIEEFVKPEEKELFEEETLPPIKTIRKRPLVRHDMIFGDVGAKKGIPKEDNEKPELPPPPMPPLMSAPKKKGFFAKLFKKKV